MAELLQVLGELQEEQRAAARAAADAQHAAAAMAGEVSAAGRELELAQHEARLLRRALLAPEEHGGEQRPAEPGEQDDAPESLELAVLFRAAARSREWLLALARGGRGRPAGAAAPGDAAAAAARAGDRDARAPACLKARRQTAARVVGAGRAAALASARLGGRARRVQGSRRRGQGARGGTGRADGGRGAQGVGGAQGGGGGRSRGRRRGRARPLGGALRERDARPRTRARGAQGAARCGRRPRRRARGEAEVAHGAAVAAQERAAQEHGLALSETHEQRAHKCALQLCAAGRRCSRPPFLSPSSLRHLLMAAAGSAAAAAAALTTRTRPASVAATAAQVGDIAAV
jgi:hypothetical protein